MTAMANSALLQCCERWFSGGKKYQEVPFNCYLFKETFWPPLLWRKVVPWWNKLCFGMFAGSILEGKKKCKCSSVKHYVMIKEKINWSFVLLLYILQTLLRFQWHWPSQEDDLQACSRFSMCLMAQVEGEPQRPACQQALLLLARIL